MLWDSTSLPNGHRLLRGNFIIGAVVAVEMSPRHRLYAHVSAVGIKSQEYDVDQVEEAKAWVEKVVAELDAGNGVSPTDWPPNPWHCAHKNSCMRNRQCMYAPCVHTTHPPQPK